MARRRTVFGLPIGKKKRALGGKALLAVGAGVAAVPGAVAAARKARSLASSGSESMDKLSGAATKVQQLTDGIGSHGTTIGKIGAAVAEMGKLGGSDGSSTPKLSHLIEEHTEIAVPRTVAYNQWTQFEMLPSIVKGAEQVEQLERERTSWRSKIGPAKREWTAEITHQVPDERIAWRSTGGLEMNGVVTFHSLDEDLTRVLVQIEYTPRGTVEQVANLLRVQRRRVRRDLRLFKHFLELRGEATGAWRQRIAKKGGAEGGRSSDHKAKSPRRNGSTKASVDRGPRTKNSSRPRGNGRKSGGRARGAASSSTKS